MSEKWTFTTPIDWAKMRSPEDAIYSDLDQVRRSLIARMAWGDSAETVAKAAMDNAKGCPPLAPERIHLERWARAMAIVAKEF